MTVGNRSNEKYREHAMVVTKEKFQKGANPPGHDATDKSDVQQPVWIVPAPFSAVQYVHEKRVLSGIEASEIDWCEKFRRGMWSSSRRILWQMYLD